MIHEETRQHRRKTCSCARLPALEKQKREDTKRAQSRIASAVSAALQRYQEQQA